MCVQFWVLTNAYNFVKHRNQDIEQFHHLPVPLCSFVFNSSPDLQFLATTAWPSVPVVLPFPGTLQYIAFGAWLLPLSIRDPHTRLPMSLVCSFWVMSNKWYSISCLYMCTPTPTHPPQFANPSPLEDTCFFPVWSDYESSYCKHSCAGFRVNQVLFSLICMFEIARSYSKCRVNYKKLFSKVTVPFCLSIGLLITAFYNVAWLWKYDQKFDLFVLLDLSIL